MTPAIANLWPEFGIKHVLICVYILSDTGQGEVANQRYRYVSFRLPWLWKKRDGR
jgi:hypothetical protein